MQRREGNRNISRGVLPSKEQARQQATGEKARKVIDAISNRSSSPSIPPLPRIGHAEAKAIENFPKKLLGGVKKAVDNVTGVRLDDLGNYVSTLAGEVDKGYSAFEAELDASIQNVNKLRKPSVGTTKQGTHTFDNGDEYVGETKNGKPHGQGTYVTFANGDEYVGEFRNGKKHGQGTLTSVPDDKYVGEWKDGKEHGQGTYTDSKGHNFVGGWKDGERHGQGTVTFANGNKFAGEWKDGKRTGQVTYTYADQGEGEGSSTASGEVNDTAVTKAIVDVNNNPASVAEPKFSSIKSTKVEPKKDKENQQHHLQWVGLVYLIYLKVL